MLPRINPMVAVILVLCAIVAGQYGLSRYRAASYAAQTQKLLITEAALAVSVAAQKRSERALQQRERLRASQARADALAGHQLSTAVADSPEWARQPVPEGVRAAFQE